MKVSGHDGWEWLIPSIKMLSTFALLDLIDINFRSDISAIVMHQRFAAPLQATQIQPSVTCSNFVSCVVPMEYPHSMCLPSLSLMKAGRKCVGGCFLPELSTKTSLLSV